MAELTEAKALITVEAFHDFNHLAMGRQVEAIPRNPVGKIQKKDLRQEIARKLAPGSKTR